MPSGGTGYPNPGRYWGFLRLTLAEVFEANDADIMVVSLQDDLNQASADEQLFFSHYEPLEVAASITGTTPSRDMLDKYTKPVHQNGWGP